MRAVAIFFRKTAIGGALFLLPLALVLFLLGHVYAVVRPVAREAAALIGQVHIDPVWLTVATIVVIVLAAFLAGLVAVTKSGHLAIERIETLVLQQLPGYSLLKSATMSVADSLGETGGQARKKTVLVGGNEGWQIGFVMAEFDDAYAVFTPEAPALDSGAVVFVARDKVVEIGVSPSDVLTCLRRFGARPPQFPLPRTT